MSAPSWPLEKSFTSLPELLFEHTRATPVENPSLLAINTPLVKLLELDESILRSSIGLSWLSGNSAPPNTTPIAQAYAGHQFGRFVPTLGDGRALLLGEHRLSNGELYDIQLKGSGRTKFSRGGDGRAALGPMVREYIVGEFLSAVGIPTTPALAVTITGESIQREKPLIGAILTRVAKSHIRIGTFEYLHARSEHAAIEQLVNYCISRHYPECQEAPDPVYSFCKRFIERTASLVSQWLHVGFIHGVLNTDNITISGQSIDFGPCAFIDTYDPATVFSSIDVNARYAYGAQPSIMHWNLARFLETVLFLLDDDTTKALEKARDLLQHFETVFHADWHLGIRAKLGLNTTQPEDAELATDFLNLLFSNKLDFTQSFRLISESSLPLESNHALSHWHKKWIDRIHLSKNKRSTDATFSAMKQTNPLYIPRNHIVEKVLSTCQQTLDSKELDKLLSFLRAPYTEVPATEVFHTPPPPEWKGYKTFCGT